MSGMFVRRRKDRKEQENPPFWRQRGWQVAVAFLVLVVVGGGLAILRGGGAASVAGAPNADSPQPGCPAATTGGELPTAPPSDLKWMKLTGFLVPTAPSAGPGRIDGPVWSCFAHTPMGAVVSAHCILMHMSGGDWRVVAERQLLPGAGRDIFEAIRSAVPDTDGQSQQPASYVGFLVTSYAPRSATVELLMRQPAGQLVSTSVSEQWSDGDWKVVPEVDGSLYTSLQTVNSDAGFIKWGV